MADTWTHRCDWRGRVRKVEGREYITTPRGSLTHVQGRCEAEGTVYVEAVSSWYCPRHSRSKQAR